MMSTPGDKTRPYFTSNRQADGKAWWIEGADDTRDGVKERRLNALYRQIPIAPYGTTEARCYDLLHTWYQNKDVTTAQLPDSYKKLQLLAELRHQQVVRCKYFRTLHPRLPLLLAEIERADYKERYQAILDGTIDSLSKTPSEKVCASELYAIASVFQQSADYVALSSQQSLFVAKIKEWADTNSATSRGPCQAESPGSGRASLL